MIFLDRCPITGWLAIGDAGMNGARSELFDYAYLIYKVVCVAWALGDRHVLD